MGGLGIVAGGGVLPRRIAETAVAGGREVFLVAFEGHTDPATVAGFPTPGSNSGRPGPRFGISATPAVPRL